MLPRTGSSHHAAAGGGGVIPLMAQGMPIAAERARHEVDHCPCQASCTMITVTDLLFLNDS